jgi:hypothetical protein
MNIIQSFLQWRRRKKEFRQQQNLLKVFATFEQAERSRLIFIDEQNKRVLLSDILTAPFALNNKQWEGFFNNLASWFRFRILQDYWERKRIEVETAAIREARHEHKHLSNEEIQLIRVHAQSSMEYEQPDDHDELFAYDFCICEGLLRSSTKAEAIGRWDNGHISLSMVN